MSITTPCIKYGVQTGMSSSFLSFIMQLVANNEAVPSNFQLDCSVFIMKLKNAMVYANNANTS